MTSPQVEKLLGVRQEVRRAYNSAASAYREGTLSYTRFPGLREEVRAFVDELPAGPVLDLGCGSGRDGLFVRGLGRRVVFADAALELLRRIPRVAGVCCDVLSLPFPDEVFSGVIASGVLLHLPRASCPGALTEIRRTTMVGGRISLSMKLGSGEGWRRSSEVPDGRWFTYYAIEEFVDLCAQAELLATAAWKSHREDWFTVTVTRPLR